MGQKIKLGFAIFLLIIMCAIGIPALLDSRGQSGYAKPVATPQVRQYSHAEAYAEAEAIISKYLKSPSTAKFPSIVDVDIKDLGDGGFQVEGYVDAQNSFGAMLRQNWQMVFQFVGDGVDVRVVGIDGQLVYKKPSTK
jgi:hypothetical protein